MFHVKQRRCGYPAAAPLIGAVVSASGSRQRARSATPTTFLGAAVGWRIHTRRAVQGVRPRGVRRRTPHERSRASGDSNVGSADTTGGEDREPDCTQRRLVHPQTRSRPVQMKGRLATDMSRRRRALGPGRKPRGLPTQFGAEVGHTAALTDVAQCPARGSRLAAPVPPTTERDAGRPLHVMAAARLRGPLAVSATGLLGPGQSPLRR